MEKHIDRNFLRAPFPLQNPPQKPPGKGILNFIRWLFTLNGEERIRAGIYTGREPRDLMFGSSLIIPHRDEEEQNRPEIITSSETSDLILGPTPILAHPEEIQTRALVPTGDKTRNGIAGQLPALPLAEEK